MTEEPRLLGGRYQLGALLGRGGMAEVRHARDIRLNRDVAVKQLRIDLATDPTFQERFRREAQAAAGLNHPNIVAVYDTGEEADPATGTRVPYIVMELVEGHTLREILRTGRQIQPKKALEFTEGVLEALNYSHKAGIIHRDIKPANVMLTPDGTVKVMDFGIARAVSDTSATMTQTAAVIGTAQYLSPEQARGETVDARSDIYSAGCLLYELLVGRPPFIGDSPVSVAYQHVREAPVPPSQLDAMITPEMDTIVLKSLAKNPQDRYQTAAAMRNDIARVLAGHELLTRLPSPAPADAAATTMAVPQANFASGGFETGATQAISAQAEPRGKRRYGVLAFVIALLAIAGIFGAYFVYNLSAQPAKVNVPNVLKMKKDDATAQLEALNLKAQTSLVVGPDDDTVGTVTKQFPLPNTAVDPGMAIQIEVNVGPDKLTIPSGLVAGKCEDVVQQLKDLGFEDVRSEDDPNEEITDQKDTVTELNPAQGKSVPVGSPIVVYCATGLSEVPSVTDMLPDKATEIAALKGFKCKFEEVEDEEHTAGIVFSQKPEAGTMYDRTKKITCYVAKQPEPTVTPSDTTSPTDSTSPQTSPTQSSDIGGGIGPTDSQEAGDGTGQTEGETVP